MLPPSAAMRETIALARDLLADAVPPGARRAVVLAAARDGASIVTAAADAVVAAPSLPQRPSPGPAAAGAAPELPDLTSVLLPLA